MSRWQSRLGERGARDTRDQILREPEVDEHDPLVQPFARENDVARLHIAVDHSAAMRVRERLEHRRDARDREARRAGHPHQAVRERGTVEQFLHEIEVSVVGNATVAILMGSFKVAD